MRSWRTTVGGVLIATGGVLQPLGDPWSLVGALLIAVGGVFMSQARDDVVSSEGTKAAKARG